MMNEPFRLIYKDFNGEKTASTPDFYFDMIALLRQLNGVLAEEKPDKTKVLQWMERHPSGLDDGIAENRKRNKLRIINKIIDKIDEGTFTSAAFQFEDGLSRKQKIDRVTEWWNTEQVSPDFCFPQPGNYQRDARLLAG
ncbi:MAG: hypothetical protein U5L09_11290 [Bacteroidales bacterium]|nr:hypothetical protein [Bacteroidales bacterium]